jgi:putative peptidoglycan lipid II flippase
LITEVVKPLKYYNATSILPKKQWLDKIIFAIQLGILHCVLMRILRSAFLVSFFTIVSRISGFVRDILIATLVGSGFFADVFFAAFKLTNLLRKVLIEGSFFAAFVPSFSRIKEQYGLLEVKRFSSKMFSIAFYVMIGIVVIANIFMPQVTKFMAPGFTGEKLAMTVSLSYIIFWYFIAISLISILSGVLNGLHRFSYYAIVPIFMNLAIIGFVLFAKDSFTNIAYCLAWSVVFGGIVQFMFIYGACVYEKFVVSLYPPKKSLFDEHTKASYKKMIPSIIGGGLTQINTMVDLILGSYIVSGVSYLYYVDRIFFLPSSVIGTAISIVILPFISRQIALKRIDKADKYIKEAIHLASILVFPASVLLFLNAEMIISIVFERGAFTTTDVHFVSQMLKILAIALPFSVFNKITSTIFFSYSDTKTPMIITFISVIINVAVSVSLMPHLGIYAITIGTAVSYVVSFLIGLTILLYKKILHLSADLLKFFIVILTSSVVTFCIMQWVSMHDQFGYVPMVYKLGIFPKLSYITTLICGAGIFYITISLMCGINIINILIAKKEKKS